MEGFVDRLRMRHAVVETPPQATEPGQPDGLPAEALAEPARRKFFNKRRDRDPLGEGFACTWRTRLIKVAAEVITRSRAMPYTSWLIGRMKSRPPPEAM